jgi:hypothetical protein
MGRKRLKAATLAGKPKTTFDLRSEYVGGQPPHSAAIEVMDPLNTSERIVVFRAIRSDPLARLHDRGQIDEAQYRAGRHWQSAYERAEISGARAIDPTKEAVDGGQIARAGITDAQAAAFATLAKAAKTAGVIGTNLLIDVLAHGMTTEQVSRARGYSNQRSADFYARLFRETLDGLAIEFGYAARKR